jgi:hypothetical protein
MSTTAKIDFAPGLFDEAVPPEEKNPPLTWKTLFRTPTNPKAFGGGTESKSSPRSRC